MIVILFLFLLLGCEEMRGINVCKIDAKKNIAHCANGDDKKDKPLSEMQDWYAISKNDMQKMAEKLQNCEQAKAE